MFIVRVWGFGFRVRSSTMRASVEVCGFMWITGIPLEDAAAT